MRVGLWSLIILMLLTPPAPAADLGAPTTKPLPVEWIDRATGHRIVRLSTEDGSQSLYFHQNAYTPDGKRLLINTPGGISAIDLATRQIEQVVEGKVSVIVTGLRSGNVYYRKGRDVYAADVNTRQSKKVATLPDLGANTSANITSVNADETLLVGTVTEGGPAPTTAPDGRPLTKAQRINARFDLHLPVSLLTINLATGESRRLHRGNHWLNHVQFSPADPNLILFCHEGPWHKVDRTWMIRTDGTDVRKVHPRTMAMEIAGHEFFSADGQSIWYDLQTPRGEVFWLAGLHLSTGRRTWYHLQRDEWSVHFNISPDGQLFAGDGGGPGMVAHAPDGKWIYLFRPEMPEDRSSPEVDTKDLVHAGVFRAEKLVDMSKHDYLLEPNVSFTPDMKWIVFRSNLLGPTHVYAVEVAKATIE